ncbi:MAG: WD40 repeat domain-containing protein [Campylobacterota bacterium]|nr:WD40 repeat domain-containing protein [Campylobacterota bacterium]
MEAIKVFNIKRAVLLLKTLDDGRLAVIDSDTTLRLYNTNDYAAVGGFKTNIVQSRTVGSFVDVVATGNFSASIIPESGKAALFSVAKKEILYKVGRHQGEIESVVIDPNSRYLVTGGEDGKTFAWALKTARLAFTMPPHSDYVTSIVFNDSGQFIATGSFDKTINLLNIATMKPPLKLRAHSSAIIKMLFLPNMRLLSADRDGGLIVWDIQKGKVLSRLKKMNDDITSIVLSTDKKFLFVGTKLGYVSLYDTSSYQQLTQRYMKISESITSLGFIEDGYRLAVGTADGNVNIFLLLGDEAHLKELIESRLYKEYYDEVEDNPIIMYSDTYKMVEKMWEKTVLQAKIFMEKGDSKRANAIFSPFLSVPKKRTFITNFMKNFEKFEQFKSHIKNQKYPLAYTMAHQCPEFKESKIFNQLELHWKKLFLQAQKLVVQKDGENQARQILAPFRGISDKTQLMQQLFTQQKMYIYFKKLISIKEFKKVFELIKNHPFLMEFSEYDTLINYADTIYIKSQESFKNREYPKAQQLCEILFDFPDFAEEARDMSDTIKAYRLFYDATHSDNIANAFAYMSSYPLLYETKEGAKLEKLWTVQVDIALKLSSKGDAFGVRDSIQEYLNIDAKKAAIANLFGQCYIRQLETLLKQSKDPLVIQRGVKRYVEMFGLEDLIQMFYVQFCKKFGETFDIEELHQGSIDSWNSSHIVEKIEVG